MVLDQKLNRVLVIENHLRQHQRQICAPRERPARLHARAPALRAAHAPRGDRVTGRGVADGQWSSMVSGRVWHLKTLMEETPDAGLLREMIGFAA